MNTADALFCEGCGYDFTTGTMPRQATSTNPLDLGPPTAPAAAAAQTTASGPVSPSTASALEVDWVAEVWIDPDWYAEQSSDEECPSPGLPMVVPLRARSLLIGRTSRSRNIHPEIECSADIGVSRRQAQLTSDGQRWWVEDLQSANGTYVGAASAPLPIDSLTPGQRRELALDDRIYVGAWTCIVVRRATPEERAGQA
ncbi:MAG: FHA domain-containing protein [Actinomycetota bacterium]